jgi:hypothetical protein
MATPTLVQVTHNQINSLAATGLSVTLPAATTLGNALVAVVFGQKGIDPFGQRTDTNPYQSTQNATPAPVLNDNENNTWASLVSITNVDMISATPVYPSTSESDPDLFAQYPSVYVFDALNVAVSTQTVNVRASYLGQNVPWNSKVSYLIGDAVNVSGVVYVATAPSLNVTPPNGGYWAVVATPSSDSRFAGGPGKPVYGGIDVVLLDFSGIATSSATDGTPVAGTSVANPATAGSPGTITTTSSGDLILAVGLQKDSNEFSAPTGWTVAWSGKLIGSEEHYVIMYQIQAASGAITPGFTNPVGRTAAGSDIGPTTSAGYETIVLAAALKHS